MCVVLVLRETTVVGLVRGITLPVAASAREVFMVEAIEDDAVPTLLCKMVLL